MRVIAGIRSHTLPPSCDRSKNQSIEVFAGSQGIPSQTGRGGTCLDEDLPFTKLKLKV